MRLLVAATLSTALLAAPAVTVASATRSCAATDLRYPFRSGGPKDFGVFELRVTGGGCATAHRIAKAWMRRFEAALDAGHVRLPKSVGGFAFETLRPTEAQSYNERGRKGQTTIRFAYRVPNG